MKSNKNLRIFCMTILNEELSIFELLKGTIIAILFLMVLYLIVFKIFLYQKLDLISV